MQKSLSLVLPVLASGLLLVGLAPAQQAPASTPPASGSSSSGQAASGTSAKKTTSATAAKKPAARAAAPLVLKTDKEKQSYAMGMNLGLGLHNQGLTLDPALVARGMKDAMTGAKTALTDEEARTAVHQFQTEAMERRQAKAKELSAENRKQGDAFLAANKSKDGVVALPSGLQYKILNEGKGPKPTASDTVSCNYRGMLIDGKEFDSSYKRGEPTSFPVGGVIKGWTEALQLMPVGSKWQLFVPPDLAYGDNPPPGGAIAPGDTLIFEVELLAIGEQKKQ